MDTSLGPILVVEDEQDHAVLIRAVFEHRSLGALIHIVSTGPAALDYLEGVPPYHDRAEHPLPEVIILDLSLPALGGFGALRWLSESEEHSGFAVLRWLSESKEHSDIPVIVFTSSTDPEDERRAYSLGARAYKTKPADFGDLVDVVRDVVGKWLRPHNLSMGDNDIGQVS